MDPVTQGGECWLPPCSHALSSLLAPGNHLFSTPVVLPFPEYNMVSACGNVLLLLSNTALETHEVIVLLFFIGSFLFIAE